MVEGDKQPVIGGYDVSSPYYLHPSELTNTILSLVLLRGENYEEWSQAMRNSLRAKNKLGFVDGTIKPPESSSDNAQWIRVNSMVGGWIYASLDPSIRSTVMITDSAKYMWDDIQERFSIGNGPRVHELKTQLMEWKQKGHSIVTYYGKLRQIWDELDAHDTVKTCVCGCRCGAVKGLAKERENEKVHQFLLGLDPFIYGNVVSSILITDPLPSLNVVYSKLVTEERHQSLVRSQKTRSDNMSFATQAATRGRNNNSFAQTNDREYSRANLTCTHCGRTGHDQVSCFKLVGYPEWWPNNKVTQDGGNRGGGRSGKPGRYGRGRGSLHTANTTTSRNCSEDAQQPVIDADRVRLPSFTNEQWATLTNLLNNVVANLLVAIL